MSYYFGVTLKSHSVLVSDLSRSEYVGEELRGRQLGTKVFKIRENLYLTGAGLLHFVDDMGLRAFPQVFQKTPGLRLEDVKESLKSISEWLDQNYGQLIQTMTKSIRDENIDAQMLLEQDTALLLGGVDENAHPFLVDFHSVENFRPRLMANKFTASIPALYPSGTTIEYVERLHKKMLVMVKDYLKQLKEIQDSSQQLALAVKVLPGLIAIAAQEYAGVSREYEIVVVGSRNSDVYSGTS